MSDILRWQERKTCKPHECFGCGKTYPAGSKMVYSAYADGGTVQDCYWCKTCQEYMRRNFEPGEETGEGEIYGGDPEGWNALKAELEAPHE
jgi:predicted  nucleic acid-binding Zn-ribbon protein